MVLEKIAPMIKLMYHLETSKIQIKMSKISIKVESIQSSPKFVISIIMHIVNVQL